MTLTNDKSQNQANNKIYKLGYEKTNKQTQLLMAFLFVIKLSAITELYKAVILLFCSKHLYRCQ